MLAVEVRQHYCFLQTGAKGATMTNAQIRSLSRIYILALALLVVGVSMAAIGKTLAVTMWGFTDDWSDFPLQLVSPEIAYFFGGWAAIFLMIMLVRSRKLLKLEGAERLESYASIHGAQTFVGGFTLALGAVMIPVSFLLPMFSGLAGFSYSFLTYSGVGIHFATQALNKRVKSGEPAHQDAIETNDRVTADAPTAAVSVAAGEASEATKSFSAWDGGPATLSGAFFAVAALLALPTLGTSQADMGAGLARFFAVIVGAMQIGPTIYALAKGYRDLWVCLGLGLLTIVVFVVVGVR